MRTLRKARAAQQVAHASSSPTCPPNRAHLLRQLVNEHQPTRQARGVVLPARKNVCVCYATLTKLCPLTHTYASAVESVALEKQQNVCSLVASICLHRAQHTRAPDARSLRARACAEACPDCVERATGFARGAWRAVGSLDRAAARRVTYRCWQALVSSNDSSSKCARVSCPHTGKRHLRRCCPPTLSRMRQKKERKKKMMMKKMLLIKVCSTYPT